MVSWFGNPGFRMAKSHRNPGLGERGGDSGEMSLGAGGASEGELFGTTAIRQPVTWDILGQLCTKIYEEYHRR